MKPKAIDPCKQAKCLREGIFWEATGFVLRKRICDCRERTCRTSLGVEICLNGLKSILRLPRRRLEKPWTLPLATKLFRAHGGCVIDEGKGTGPVHGQEGLAASNATKDEDASKSIGALSDFALFPSWILFWFLPCLESTQSIV